jgi:uncharacterized tellurite resistance protein B-like protein
MLEFLKNIFLLGVNDKSNKEINNNKRIQIATCALFIEVANADNDFKPEEKLKIISFMRSAFNLEEEYIREIMELANEKTKESISLYEFTSELNKSFTFDEKYTLMKNLWKLIFADNDMNMYEERMVKRIGGIINLDHHVVIASKLEVKKELKIN